MRKNAKSTIMDEPNNKLIPKKLDKLNIKIIELLVLGLDNKEISYRLAAPLSTIQRRTRSLFEKVF